jgi:hypothetical protein
MAPQEVASLQALAKAHGGSLTVNPDTGLPEAGFLSSILPMVAGAFLGPAGFGLTAAQAGLAAGALGTVATGSLKKGIMAGLGAYGGAGLAGGLMSAGAAEAGAAGAAGAGASEMAATKAALQQNALTNLGVNSSAAAGTGAMSFAPGMSTNVLGTAPIAGPMSVPVPVTASQLSAGIPQVATATPIPTTSTFMGNVSQMGRGVENLFTPEGRTAFMGNAASKGVAATGVGGAKGLMQYGLAAASPFMTSSGQGGQAPASDSRMPQRLQYDAGMAPVTPAPDVPGYGELGRDFGRQQSYFPNAGYRNISDAEAKALRGYADGGPVQEMSDKAQAQTLMANNGLMFAAGGVATATEMPADEYEFDPETRTYRKVVREGKRTTTSSGSGGSAPQGPSDWSQRSPAERAAYYADRPMEAALARGAQTLFGYTTPGALSQFLAPDAWHSSMAEKQGFDPSQTSFGRGAGSLFGLFGAPQEAVPKAGADVYGYGDYTMNTNYNGSLDRDTLSGYQTGQNGLPSELGGSAFPGSGGFNYGVGPSGFGSNYGDTSMGGSSSFESAYGGAQGGGYGTQGGVSGVGVGSSEGVNSMDSQSDSYSGGADSNPGNSGSSDSNSGGGGSEGGGGGDNGEANGGLLSLARGGSMSHLGDYSDGGRLLRGPGDGVSDSIPATIGNKRPARLADGEFVVPARIVSELGNGSTEAGARKLYAMMDRIQKGRKKSIGKGRVAVNSRADKLLPA